MSDFLPPPVNGKFYDLLEDSQSKIELDGTIQIDACDFSEMFKYICTSIGYINNKLDELELLNSSHYMEVNRKLAEEITIKDKIIYDYQNLINDLKKKYPSKRFKKTLEDIINKRKL